MTMIWNSLRGSGNYALVERCICLNARGRHPLGVRLSINIELVVLQFTSRLVSCTKLDSDYSWSAVIYFFLFFVFTLW